MPFWSLCQILNDVDSATSIIGVGIGQLTDRIHTPCCRSAGEDVLAEDISRRQVVFFCVSPIKWYLGGGDFPGRACGIVSWNGWKAF